MTDDAQLPLNVRLNQQTARIYWDDLARFFARGRVLQVSDQLDLIEVGVALSTDDLARFENWTQKGAVRHLPDELAKQWAVDDSNLWGLVIAPWVLVQRRV